MPWRDWKEDLVPLPSFFFGTTPRVIIPPELTSEATLLAHLGMSAAELKKVWWYRRRMYQSFHIGKGKGKIRVISAPDARLKFLQRKITRLLDQIYRPRNPVHGFLIGRSVKTNAISHINSKFVLNVDISDFFPSITGTRICGLLNALGINNRVSEILARLCCNDAHLPQGAPSSPVLSNMICFRLDKELLSIAKEARCIYTRYADDVTFSSYQPLSLLFGGTVPSTGAFAPELLTDKLRGAFASNGFVINPKKAHYADRHSRRMVTGLKINEVLNVDRKFVRNIRAALHSIEKNGLAAAQEKFEKEYGGTANIAAHLQGKISWLGNIKGQSDPVFRAIAGRFNLSFPARMIKVTPTDDEIRDRSVWIVEDSEGGHTQGSAFFLDGVGLVTAAHCVSGGHNFVVYHPTKPANRFAVTVDDYCNIRDLAILGHNIAANEYFQMKQSTRVINVRDEVVAIGYPGYGPGDKTNIRTGRVSSLPVKSAVHYIEVALKLAKGMSGGPVIDSTQGVVGVILKGGFDEDRDFAVHIRELNDWLSVTP